MSQETAKFPMKMLEHDEQWVWKTYGTCPTCKEEFTGIFHRTALSTQVSRKPYILYNCKHVICEVCLKIKVDCSVKNRTYEITCDDCSKSFKLNKKAYWRDDFNYNYYLFGQLSYRHHRMRNLNDRSVEMNLSSTSNNSIREVAVGRNTPKCNECSQRLAQKHCVQCAVLYCSECFQSVHSYAKSLKSHQFIHFYTTQINSSQISCDAHGKSKTLNCRTCTESICEDCVSNHNEHTITSLKSENIKHKTELLQMINMLKEASSSCQAAGVETNSALKIYKKYTEEFIDEISRQYIFMHSALQQHERNNFENVKKQIAPRMNTVTEIYTKLKSNYEEIMERIQLFQQFDNEMPNDVNVEEILSQTNKWLKNLAVHVQFEGLNETPFILNTDSDFESDISGYLETIIGPSIKYEMVTFPQEKLLNLRNFPSKSSGASTSKRKDVVTNKHKSSSTPAVDDNIQNKPVYISHIDNPESIYIQTKQFHEKADQLFEMYESLAKISKVPNFIRIHVVYLIYDNKKWYRGKMLGKSYDTYNFHFVDYGMTKNIKPSNIREMPMETTKMDYGATLCTLYNIKPVHCKWTEEVNQLIYDIVEKDMLAMFVVDKDHSPIKIELMSKNGKIPILLRDALIFAGFAQQIEDKSNLIPVRELELYKKCLLDKYSQKIDNNESLEFGTVISVKVISIISPGEFYCRNASYEMEFNKLLLKFEQFYNNRDNKKFLFLMPRARNICAILDCNSKWHRAIILSVSIGHCEVQLIDMGTTEKVSWDRLFKLEDEFLSSDTLLHCELSDVKPKREDNYEWSTDACDFFKKSTLGKVHEYSIQVERMQNRVAVVTLSLVKGNCKVNVNALLAKFNYVISTGLSSKENQLTKYSSDNLPDNAEAQTASNQINLQKTNKRIEVNLPVINSPGEFYIVLEKYSQGVHEFEKKLQLEMKKIQTKPSLKSWEINENCVIFANLVNFTACDQYLWYRASVTERLPGHAYKVFLRDKGYHVEVAVESMHAISNDMNSLCDAVMRCELACVKPTGGQTDWSKTVIEKFEEIVEKFTRLAITMQGPYDEETKGWPVILWGVIEITENAFAPNTKKYLNINKYMVNEGYFHVTKSFETEPDALDVLEKSLLRDYDNKFSDWFRKINAIKIVPDPNGLEMMLVDEDINNINEGLEDEVLARQFENVRCTRLLNWPNAKLNRKHTFDCIPTYVDNNFVIYLHETKHSDYLHKLMVIINERDLSNNLKYCKYKIDQPCLVRYHADSKFYRGKVTDVLNNSTYKVQFVDYGNVELVNTNDLRDNLIATNIPILANKYRLCDVSPIFSSGWPVDAIDYLHKLIVAKHCQLVIDSNYKFQNNIDGEEVIPCRLSLQECGLDVSRILVESNYFQYSSNGFSKNAELSINWDPLDDVLQPIISNDPNTPQSKYNKYKKMFDDMNNIIESIKNDEDEDDELDLDDESNLSILNKIRNSYSNNLNNEDVPTYKDGAMDGEDDLCFVENAAPVVEVVEVLEDEEDVPLNSFGDDSIETSTTIEGISHNYFFPGYNLIKLNSLEGFDCVIQESTSPIYFIVAPQFPEYTEKLEKLDKFIHDNIAFTTNLVMKSSNIPCIAYYAEQQKWCRAYIEKYDFAEQKFVVTFVDYNIKASLIPIYIKNYMDDWQHILNCPLRILSVRLYKMKVNKARLTSINGAMSEFLQKLGKTKVYAKVMKSETIPGVELYVDSSCKELIYQQLIDDQYFIKAKS